MFRSIPLSLRYSFTFIATIGLLMLMVPFIEGCSESRASAGQLTKTLPKEVDFNFHIRPILSDRCYTCHGPDENKRESGLRFDKEESVFAELKDNPGHFAIIKGKPAESELYKRIHEEDPGMVMPPPESNLTLTDYEKALLSKWIEQGGKWKKHWSFIPPEKEELPFVKGSDWVKNEIDHFVLQRLEQENIKPAPEADKVTLIRRLSFDLTGLPPSLEEIDAFLADNSPDAYEKLLDRLLESPHYGERMASEWLDVARYADSHGYQDDPEYRMWPWRDWVIHAFNTNLSYKDFIEWQTAGDLIPDAKAEQVMATGFNRNHAMTNEGGVIPEEYRIEYVADRAQTTATAFLGLTMECARCHTHKYDPLTHTDYYKFFAFFNNVPEDGIITVGAPMVAAPRPYLELSPEELNEQLAFIKDFPEEETFQVSVLEDSVEPRITHILRRGQYHSPAEEVQAGTPAALLPMKEGSPANRLGLAKWLTDSEHPLTARVAVNRYWQMHFGNGIVGTPEDFGKQGALPTHPELLDWMSVHFMDSGWDLKALHKLMLSSATYRQSSNIRPELQEVDPENALLAHGPRYRLPAEMIRDQVLAVSGLLVPKVGGPSVKPYQPEGLWAATTAGRGLTKYEPDTGDGLYRRSLYTFWKRTLPPPAMLTFDAAERSRCVVHREATSTPLQALIMLNDPQIVEASRVLAYKLMKEREAVSERLQLAFRMIISREARPEEIALLETFFNSQLSRFSQDAEAADELIAVGDFVHPEDQEAAETAAYTLAVSSIFNLNSAVTKH